MKKRDINDVLADNLSAAIERKFGEVNQSALARESKVAQTTIGVLLHPKRRMPTKSGKVPSATLTQLVELAEALGIAPWELLHPDLERAKQEHELFELITQQTDKIIRPLAD